MARNKSGTVPPPTPLAVNPYAVARKSIMLSKRVTAVDVWKKTQELGHEVNIATVRAVINGIFRNEHVIEAFHSCTGVMRAVAFPQNELEWISHRKRAERDVLEAAG